MKNPGVYRSGIKHHKTNQPSQINGRNKMTKENK
jgi:hypothetical protein